jgi:hypothetical protein
MLRRTAALAALLAAAPAATAAAAPTDVLVDPFTNPESNHATVVEPDTFAAGGRIVAVAQIGRYFDGGASGNGFATWTDAGAVLASGALPGLTDNNGNGGTHDRATDAVVAYSAKHNVWMASSLVLDEDASGAPGGTAVVVNRSTDGGISWGNPVNVAVAGAGADYDKNWVACDNTVSSPFYGRCYHTWDDFGDGDRMLFSFSTNGGLNWSAPVPTAAGDFGLGGQPVIQKSGTVIVPFGDAFGRSILSTRSTNGGVTWQPAVQIGANITHQVNGNLRDGGGLPSAEIDGAGKVYVVWQDCRFRKGCRTNDIVMSTSLDGVTWSAVQRIPLDSATSGVDHFLPGIGVDVATSGATAKLGLTHYFYRNGRCGRKSCELEVGYSQSNDGGATWSGLKTVAGPFLTTSAPLTTQGYMVADYISTSWSGGKAFSAFPVADAAPVAGVFDLPLKSELAGLTPGTAAFTGADGDHAIAGAAGDHASPRSKIRLR